MTRDAGITQRRVAIRRDVALAVWHEIKAELGAAGLEVTLIGSLADGRFSAHSDIDILAKLGDSGLSRSAVDRIGSKASRDISVDLIFQEDLTQSDLEALLGA